MAQRMSRFEIADWVAGDALVVAVNGRLDAPACASLAGRLRELVARGPGVRITLELAGVSELDPDAWEDLVLQIAGVYARRALITFAGAHGATYMVLANLGIAAAPRGGTERGGMGRFVSGVTA